MQMEQWFTGFLDVPKKQSQKIIQILNKFEFITYWQQYLIK